MSHNHITSIELLAHDSGISIDMLCEHADINRSTFTRWKNGTMSPNMKNLQRVEQALESLLKLRRTT